MKQYNHSMTRRELLAAGAAMASTIWAKSGIDKSRISAITDEIGRTQADAVRNLFVIALMVLVGFAVGFRVHTGVLEFGGAVLLLLLFGVAFSWIMAYIGLSTGNAEAAQAASFPLMAVFVFASSAFVSTATMPGPLRVYADHQPVTATVNAVRALVLGGPTLDRVLAAVAWTVGITVVFAALSVRRYRRAA